MKLTQARALVHRFNPGVAEVAAHWTVVPGGLWVKGDSREGVLRR